ncbi:MAG: hypothetical protein M3209_00135 [Acidobacteriota bacterium]|nr:hypothetical protein [Acidobacteriota bacterium]
MPAKVFDFELNAHDGEYNFETVLQIVCEDEKSLLEMVDHIARSVKRSVKRKSDGKFIIPFGGRLIRRPEQELPDEKPQRRKVDSFTMLVNGERIHYIVDKPPEK